MGRKMVLLSQSKVDEADLAQWLRLAVMYIPNMSSSTIFRLIGGKPNPRGRTLKITNNQQPA